MSGSHYNAANHYGAYPDLPEQRLTPIDTYPEYSASLAARFPSALRHKALSEEAAAIAYHFWESRGCPRSSPDKEECASEIAAR